MDILIVTSRPEQWAPAPLVKRLNAALSGRGGGRNGFAQGSVQADRTAICDFFRKEGIECPTC